MGIGVRGLVIRLKYLKLGREREKGESKSGECSVVRAT